MNHLRYILRCRAVPRWLLVGLIMVAAGCARTPPEAALRQQIGALQQAIEARDADALEACLAQDFIGPDGLDRTGARRIAALQWMRHDRIGVSLGPLDMQMKDRHATVRFTAALTGGSNQLLPDAARAYNVETGWRLDDGEWRMTSADWDPAL